MYLESSRKDLNKLLVSFVKRNESKLLQYILDKVPSLDFKLENFSLASYESWGVDCLKLLLSKNLTSLISFDVGSLFYQSNFQKNFEMAFLLKSKGYKLPANFPDNLNETQKVCVFSHGCLKGNSPLVKFVRLFHKVSFGFFSWFHLFFTNTDSLKL